ncbi:MAG: 3'-5' exonuclease, partial [Bacteroidales bacterium]
RTLKVIGFDTETRPAFRKGQINKVALLQLSGEEYCFLFRLNIIGFPECLIDLLRDPSILKIGLSLRDDFMTMRRMAKFEPHGFIELQSYVKKFNIGEASLQKIFAILFGRKISKNQRLSNWEADSLTEGQKKYAATDAWACCRIYETLNKTK